MKPLFSQPAEVRYRGEVTEVVAPNNENHGCGPRRIGGEAPAECSDFRGRNIEGEHLFELVDNHGRPRSVTTDRIRQRPIRVSAGKHRHNLVARRRERRRQPGLSRATTSHSPTVRPIRAAVTPGDDPVPTRPRRHDRRTDRGRRRRTESIPCTGTPHSRVAQRPGRRAHCPDGGSPPRSRRGPRPARYPVRPEGSASPCPAIEAHLPAAPIDIEQREKSPPPLTKRRLGDECKGVDSHLSVVACCKSRIKPVFLGREAQLLEPSDLDLPVCPTVQLLERATSPEGDGPRIRHGGAIGFSAGDELVAPSDQLLELTGVQVSFVDRQSVAVGQRDDRVMAECLA